MGENLSGLFADPEFSNTDLAGANSPENLFSIFESLESASELPSTSFKEMDFSSKPDHKTQLAPQKSTSSTARQESETDVEASPAYKRLKCSTLTSSSEVAPDGQEPTSHIMVERNRRRQMNDHLTVLRSMMPCFYIKRGDQASIVGGVVNFIKELQQVLHSLEAKKQRKVFNEVLSPRPISSPRIAPLGPIPPPLSPRISIPISPRTPQPSSPYNPAIQHHHPKSTMSILGEVPSFESVKELAANSKSPVANVEVKFSGPNVLVRTTSQRIPGQALKIIAALQGLSLEILHVSISTIDKTMLNSFTIKIGIECKLSAEELANEIQQTFC